MTADLCDRLATLLDEKAAAYGDSISTAPACMRLLYPHGLRPDQMDDALLVVRVLDKLSRIANRGGDGKDRGGESPWQDLAGYGVLGWKKDEGR